MKIIDIGIVRDNVDPLGIGRIRYSTYNELTGEVERAKENYVPWSRDDKFVAVPLLPFNINPIPEEKQSVMIIQFNTEKDRVNVFYIPGPFTSTHDFTKENQFFQNQVTHTTYGMANDFGPDLFISDGTRKGLQKDERTKDALAKKDDFGIYGKFGSDVIFTKNGVNIRGGKLISKEFADDEQKVALSTKPLMADRSATLHLKKFPHILEYQDVITETVKGVSGNLKYMVEYSIDDFTTNGAKNVKFFVYRTDEAGTDFKLENINIGDVDINNRCVLLNPQNYFFKNNNDTTTPTFTLTGITGYIQCYVAIRNIIDTIHKYGLDRADGTNTYKEKLLHPFYFRPTKECKTRQLSTPSENNNRITIFQNITVFDYVQNGLIYSEYTVKPPIKKETKIEKALVKSSKRQEQTFAAVKSDRIYLVSTDANEFQKIIDFKKIDTYEPTQENYIRDIEPNTYSTVRGEVLIDILKSMMDLFESHQHNLTDPLVKEDPNFIRLQTQINTLENDLLNRSIRIN